MQPITTLELQVEIGETESSPRGEEPLEEDSEEIIFDLLGEELDIGIPIKIEILLPATIIEEILEGGMRNL